MKEAIENVFPQIILGGCLETEVASSFHIFDNSIDPKRCFIKRNDDDPLHFTVINLLLKKFTF